MVLSDFSIYWILVWSKRIRMFHDVNMTWQKNISNLIIYFTKLMSKLQLLFIFGVSLYKHIIKA